MIVKLSNKKRYVLKFKNDLVLQENYSIFNELIAYSLIDFLDYKIAPQEVVLIYLNDDFIEMAKEFKEKNPSLLTNEHIEIIEKSKGINIGIEFFENTSKVASVPNNKKFNQELVHIDNYLFNADRSDKNPNILKENYKDNHKKYIAIDFGASFHTGNLIYDLSKNEYKFKNDCNYLKDDNIYLLNSTVSDIKAGRNKKLTYDDIMFILNKLPPFENIIDDDFKNKMALLLSQRIGSNCFKTKGCL